MADRIVGREGVEPPLPLLTDKNRPFWTGGERGELLMPKCQSCGGIQHPPMPCCYHCGSDDIVIAPMSGHAIVMGCTVNYQQWLPDFPCPYAVAEVAIDDDPRVRLTTTIVNCDPETVYVGMPVKVVFEQHDDVWLPLFEPTGEPKAELPPLHESAEFIRQQVRPMVSPDKYEDKVALTGIGMSRLGRRLLVDPLSLTVEACRKAVEDAGLSFADIDGLSTYPSGGPLGGMAEGGVTALEDALRIRPTWYNGGGEVPGPGGAVTTAMLAVAAGLCKHVLCFRTLWQASYQHLQRTGQLKGESRGGRLSGQMEWLFPFGAASPMNHLATKASQHMARYGTTKETLGYIAINARNNASLNPTAVYRDRFTMDDYMNARGVTSPFGLLDCDVPIDGAVAVIVSAKDVARDLAKPPVFVEAVGTQLIERVAWDQSMLTHEPQVIGPAAHMWSRTSMKPADCDVALLYDGFTFNCLSWIEGLGFCEIGEAKDFLQGGHNIALDGIIPVNPHGGQLSHGRLHGFGFIHEAVTQLRGEGGARQVKDVNVAVVSSGGLTPGSAFLLKNQA
ncbi:MAG: OB-fold domain-containing protein [Acidimicrobiia bacterium]